MIFQQVDFIHIENGLIGPGQQPRFKTAFSLGQGGFKIKRPYQPVFRGPQREVHQPIGGGDAGQCFPIRQPPAAKIAQPFRVSKGTAKGAIGHQFQGGEEVDQPANGR